MLLRWLLELRRWSVGLTHRFVDAGGLNHHYLEAGPKSAPNTILLLHGFNASCGDAVSVWPGLRAKLSRREAAGFRVLSPDLAGHGMTGKSGTPVCRRTEGRWHPSDLELDLSGPQQARNVAAFLDATVAAGAKVHVCGISMGGMVAGLFAAAFPGRVASLTLVNAAGVEGPEPSPFTLSLLFPRPSPPYRMPLELPPLDQLFEHHVWLLPTTPEQTAFMFDKLVVRAKIRVPFKLLEVIARGQVVRRRLALHIAKCALEKQGGILEAHAARIRAPCLLIAGEEDNFVSPSCTPVLEEKLKQAGVHRRTLRIPRCGHAAYIDAMPECAEAILAHIAAAASAAPQDSLPLAAGSPGSEGTFELEV